MKLVSARVQNYRSVRDSGWFAIEDTKTILVGPNEAGKTAVLEALQHINPPPEVRQFEPLRDYPRKLYNADIQSGRLDPKQIPVATAKFELEADDRAGLGPGFDAVTYCYTRYLANNSIHWTEGGPSVVTYSEEIRKDLQRMATHIDKQTEAARSDDVVPPSTELFAAIDDWQVGKTTIDGERATKLRDWLDSVASHVDEGNSTEDARHTRLLGYTRVSQERAAALKHLNARMPVFVYYNNYFRVRPNLHLEHFAERLEGNLLDDDRYDFGNRCLLKLLGFTARELANQGRPPEPDDDPEQFEAYRKPLDERSIQLNAASVRLTNEIRSVWNPDPTKGEAATLRIQADGQYLKVAVQDDLGVEIELDQRSEGFQWLVSFFVVFFAEAADSYVNAILLLDEPGLSLHGLKQREFRKTISRLAKDNQTIYTTHSPFLVGPDELDLVRVVEMADRDEGEALGYDLAQSLFGQQRNLVLEGLTDLWYLDGTAQLLGEARIAALNDKIALIPANTASKVVYFATILHANHLKVAALLDSDAAGENAAKQDTLIHTLGNRNILRAADFCQGSISKPEIEDLLRDTLVKIGAQELGWDVSSVAAEQPTRPIVDIFATEFRDFSKYHLAKAYVRWTREHVAAELTEAERKAWGDLIDGINKALK
ncbi:AAA family ATPase [bacterium]|nr:AAA family ATPase [bacterium]